MSAPSDDVTIRPLSAEDGGRGFFDVLAQLTKAPPLAPAVFAERLAAERAGGVRHTLVAADASGRVLATGALLLEAKFIRGGATCAHVEDVVVDAAARGRRLGQRVVTALVELARERKCYKVILDCADDNVPFYERCGFAPKERQMTLYF